ncbi:MAG: hypothetical protein MHM6MM_008666 [Cercozoa sp. M6MM]
MVGGCSDLCVECQDLALEAAGPALPATVAQTNNGDSDVDSDIERPVALVADDDDADESDVPKDDDLAEHYDEDDVDVNDNDDDVSSDDNESDDVDEDEDEQQAMSLLYGGDVDEDDDESGDADDNDTNAKFADLYGSMSKHEFARLNAQQEWGENDDEEDEDDDDVVDNILEDLTDDSDQDDNESDNDNEDDEKTGMSRAERRMLMMDDDDADEDDDEQANMDADEAEHYKSLSDADKTRYQQARNALAQRIAALEGDLLQPRSWELMGEATTQHRDKNSLLETHLEYDVSDKVAPAITDAFTKSLEDGIIARIKADNFDDVERRYEPRESKTFKRPLALSQDKSELGLADVYAKEMMQQVDEEEDKELAAQHANIAREFAALCHDLDSLSNFVFSPAAVTHDATVVKGDVAAIALEEALPMAVSTASARAPEDVFKRQNKGALVGDVELTQKERKKKRRTKKKQAIKQREQTDREEELAARHDPRIAEKRAQRQATQEAAKVRQQQERRERREKKRARVTGLAQEAVVADDGTNYARSTQVFARLQSLQQQESMQGPKRKRRKKKSRASAASQLKL